MSNKLEIKTFKKEDDKISSLRINLGYIKNGNIITKITINEMKGYDYVKQHTTCKYCGIHITDRSCCRRIKCRSKELNKCKETIEV